MIPLHPPFSTNSFQLKLRLPSRQCRLPFSTNLNQRNTPSPDMKQFGGRSVFLRQHGRNERGFAPFTPTRRPASWTSPFDQLICKETPRPPTCYSSWDGVFLCADMGEMNVAKPPPSPDMLLVEGRGVVYSKAPLSKGDGAERPQCGMQEGPTGSARSAGCSDR